MNPKTLDAELVKKRIGELITHNNKHGVPTETDTWVALQGLLSGINSGVFDLLAPNAVEGLLPCPFCGGDASRNEITPHKHFLANLPDHPGSYCIECHSCAVGILRATEELAEQAWNTRQPTSGWLPMESAPMDGTWIDVWVSSRDNGAPAGRWTNISWGANAWRTPSYHSDGKFGNQIPGDVTHWLPLPSPPEGKAG